MVFIEPHKKIKQNEIHHPRLLEWVVIIKRNGYPLGSRPFLCFHYTIDERG